MAKLFKIGIVGCGAIGISLAKIIAKEMFRQAKLAAFYDIAADKSKKLSEAIVKNKNLAAESLEQLIAKSDLVIESAAGGSSWEIAKGALTNGRDILIMSVGGIVSHFKELSALAIKYNAKVYIPSGAIAGIDALKAANAGGIKNVLLTTRKNPLSFKGVKFIEDKGIILDKIRKDTILFSGTAARAVKYFPQNINVAAVLSLAGIGPVKTKVKIIASPFIKKNIHEVRIESRAGVIVTRTENILHPDNPKTSYLAVMSAVAVLKQILTPLKIGA
jgi:aspartate dehydrogenase